MDTITPSSTTSAAFKTPEPDSDAATRIHTNGVLKRHHPIAFRAHQPSAVILYKECLRNHAASLGAHAVDGCGEFMPSPTASSADPTSLKCAACGCHRNFHRREPEDAFPPPTSVPALEYQPHHRHHPPPPPPPPLPPPLLPPPDPSDGDSPSSPSSLSPPPISSAYYPSAPHLLLALSGGISAAAPPQENSLNRASPSTAQANGRKRFRTRFTQEQKGKMLEFAEKVGWKMQKRDEELIAEFCNGIGVEKGAFKVWMHNHKNNFGKRDPLITNGGGVEFGVNYHQHQNDQNQHQNQEHQNDSGSNNQGHQLLRDSFSAQVIGPNGSSSSS